MTKKDCLAIAKISGAHGVNGNLKIHPYAEDLSIIHTGSRLFVRRETDQQERPVTVTDWRPHGRQFLLSCKEITSRGQAENEIGGELVMLRSDLPDPGEGTYYWVDIIGLSVFTMGNARIGRVKAIFSTGSNDVYVVYDDATGAEVLVPAIKSVVKVIDLEAGVIRVDLADMPV